MSRPATRSTAAQAKTLADTIVRSSQTLYEALVAFAKIKGWTYLGFQSFGAWAEANMPVSRWVAYQELARANVLDKIATALHLPMSEVQHAAAALPQGEASAIASALEADAEIVDAIVVETSDPVEVAERVRAVAGRNIEADPNASLRTWATRCRRLSYPDALDRDTMEVLIEARTFIDDCMASWEE